MSRRFALVTVSLVATTAFLVGLIVAGSLTPAPAGSTTPPLPPGPAAASLRSTFGPPALVNFADVAERLNPAVVNIDASSRTPDEDRSGYQEGWGRGEGDAPRRGSGSGVIVEPDGHILTNYHVIEHADRIIVKLADGRSLKATVVGTDPDTDLALIKIEAAKAFPAAALGNSDSLRVGEWVCAIGNPLAYEHTVTVGVVSYIGRKLFDNSLDNYIQTDAAINFGNSGGPLINARGEVVGINSAISSRASSIGFAIPVNQAREVLPQLKAHGRVARGFIGVALKDVDPDLARSLSLSTTRGALVQDVTQASPGDRAGLRTYDLITAVDGEVIETTDTLIRRIAATRPGTTVRLELLRDGRQVKVAVKLAERPGRSSGHDDAGGATQPSRGPGREASPAGVSVRDLDRADMVRFDLPRGIRGVVIARVEPLSPAFDAELERGQVVLEVNREPIESAAEFRRVVAGSRAGDPLTLYLYLPGLEQRALRTLRMDLP